MSYLTYLASSVRLPNETIFIKPDYVFESYKEYMHSNFYKPPTFVMVTHPDIFNSCWYDFKYPVHVYQSSRNNRWLGISDYGPPATTFEDDDGNNIPLHEDELKKQDVAVQFTLPYLYYLGIGVNEFLLHAFLRNHLKAGGSAELFECWATEESEPRDLSRDQTVDLAKYNKVTGEMTTTNYLCEDGKRFVNYIVSKDTEQCDAYILSTPALRVELDSGREIYSSYLSEWLGKAVSNQG